MPCQVPSARRPSAIGSESAGPSTDALMCAGMSSGPSSVCVQYGASSGTAASNQDSKSRRTSGEAFSFSVSDAEVWSMKRCSSPTRSSPSSGSSPVTSRVMRWKPRPGGRRSIWRWSHTARRLVTGQARGAHVHASAAERHVLGGQQAALALALGERSVRADDPVPGHAVVVALREDGAREARRAGGHVAVRAHEARRGIPDPGEDSLAAAHRRVSSRVVRHGTYSIVAFDPATGEHGAAVHSHWFSVGSLCVWARPGVGAVATQSVVEPAHGPHGLDRLAGGEDAASALAALLGPDALAAVRQVALVDGAGGVAVHTGADCIPCAGDATGEHVSAQANMMARDTVPAAMVAGFEAADGDLADRLMAALDAAEGEGGDVRGRQSAALVVVPPQGEAWQARFDLRVEDHADPVEEMRRLVRLARAYELAGEADELMASDRAAEAGPLYERAAELAPESDELLFWAGLAQAHAGDAERGLAAVRQAIEANPGWRTLLERLSPDFAPAGERVRRELDSSP